MKKLALIFLLLIPVLGWSQTKHNKLMADVTLTASTYYYLNTHSDAGPWSFSVLSADVVGNATVTVTLQASNDGKAWFTYPGTSMDTLDTDTVSNFYGSYNPFETLRLMFLKGGTATVTVNSWYTFKK